MRGDREALIGLLLIAGDWAWQSRAEVAGSAEQIAASAHEFADQVADCYAADQPPSDRMCDSAFELADQVDALAIEVRLCRPPGAADASPSPASIRPAAREARHLAHAHLAALRDAAATERTITALDVESAEDLYQAVVVLGRHQLMLTLSAALRGDDD